MNITNFNNFHSDFFISMDLPANSRFTGLQELSTIIQV